MKMKLKVKILKEFRNLFEFFFFFQKQNMVVRYKFRN